MGVNFNGIGNLLVRLTLNMWLNDNFEDQRINIKRTQGNELVYVSPCLNIPSL